MAFDRRRFLSAGGGILTGAALAGSAGGEATAQTPPITGGRSVLDYGVELNSGTDQTAAIQKAIDAISESGHPVFFPGGTYGVSTLSLPKNCTIAAVPWQTVFRPRAQKPVFHAADVFMITLSGLTVRGGLQDKPSKPSGVPLVLLSAEDDAAGGWVTVRDCHFMEWDGPGLKLEKTSGILENAMVSRIFDAGISAARAKHLTISTCAIDTCAGDGIRAGDKNTALGGITITGSHVANCGGAGIAVQGSAVVNGNLVENARYGLKLGGGGQGHIIASGNLIRECAVGLGVAASGETIFASLNLINAPKEGGIRAFSGDNLVGPDLVQKSAEAYLNLTLGGNVVR